MAKSTFEADLLGATELARAALLEVTDASTIGDCVGHEVIEEGVGNLYFACGLRGYPGWRWAASLAKVSADDPVTVLEVELLPSEGALLPPDWVPWSVRLAQYKESQALLEAELAAAAVADADAFDDDLDDDDDDDLDDEILVNDFSDFDDEIDGVDIDALADGSAGDDERDDDDEDDDDLDDDDLDDDEPEGDEPEGDDDADEDAR